MDGRMDLCIWIYTFVWRYFLSKKYSSCGKIFTLKYLQNFIRNVLPSSRLKSEISAFNDCLVFLTFCCYFCKVFLYSINLAIKMKYILLELKVPWPVKAISETYNRAHNILELANILPNFSFTTSRTEGDYY